MCFASKTAAGRQCDSFITLYSIPIQFFVAQPHIILKLLSAVAFIPRFCPSNRCPFSTGQICASVHARAHRRAQISCAIDPLLTAPKEITDGYHSCSEGPRSLAPRPRPPRPVALRSGSAAALLAVPLPPLRPSWPAPPRRLHDRLLLACTRWACRH
jgi:hypothetical protein